MMHKIVIDEEKCIGCGSCAEICPNNFIMNGEKAKVKKAEVKKISCEKDAEAACPVDAISIS